MANKITKLMLNGEEYEIREYQGGGWQPGANTIAYYPLEEDTNDYSGNYNGTVVGTAITYGTIGGSTINSAYLTATRVTTSLTTMPKTISFWLYKPSSSSDSSIDNRKQLLGFNNVDGGNAICFRGVNLNQSSGKFVMHVGNSLKDSSYGVKTDQWWHIVITTDNTNRYTYINGTLAITDSGDFGTAQTGFWFGTSPYDSVPSSYNPWSYYSNLILESATWTETEIQNYFNSTKSLYGIN